MTNDADRQTAPLDEGRELATLARGVDVEFRIRLKTYEGHAYIDLREWSRRGAGQDWWPVKGRGVTVKLRELPAVIAALTEAAR